jgi:histone H3
MEYAKRKTVMSTDLYAALRAKGVYLDAVVNRGDNSLKRCMRGGASPSKKAKRSALTTDAVKKPHRFKPGTVSLRQIRKEQKHSDCLVFAKLSFERFVREIAQDYIDEARFSRAFITLVQLATENHLTCLCEYANMIALLAKRKTVSQKDLQLARHISGKDFY